MFNETLKETITKALKVKDSLHVNCKSRLHHNKEFITSSLPVLNSAPLCFGGKFILKVKNMVLLYLWGRGEVGK